MKVHRYFPEKLYGFCKDDSGLEFFFHLSVFDLGDPCSIEHRRCPKCPGQPRCPLVSAAPPPILGERVLVQANAPDTVGRATKADRVSRTHPPLLLPGVVESFVALKRYGFIKGEDQISYHLHESEVIHGRQPFTGNRVLFYPGEREGKPRACHVVVCR